jgi:hypothetical protein
VVPLVGVGGGERGAGGRVGVRTVEALGLGSLEIGALHDEPVVADVTQGPQHRVRLTHEQSPARSQQSGHRAGRIRGRCCTEPRFE